MQKDKRGPFVIIAAIMLLFALLLVSQSAWATPAQDQLQQTVPPPTPIPGPICVVPPQPGGGDYACEYVPLGSVDCSPPAGCDLFAPFDINLYLGGQPVTEFEFDPPLEICVPYTDAQANAVGGVDNLALVYYDEATSSWVELDNTRYDAGMHLLCGDLTFLPDSTCGFGITCAISPTGVPVTGEQDTAGNLRVLWLALAAAAVLAIGTITWRRARAS